MVCVEYKGTIVKFATGELLHQAGINALAIIPQK
jgi:hypothetical protein